MTDIRSTTAAKAVLAIGMMTALLLAGCGKKRTPQYVHIGPDSLPTKSYERGPEERFNRSDYVIKLKQMTQSRQIKDRHCLSRIPFDLEAEQFLFRVVDRIVFHKPVLHS